MIVDIFDMNTPAQWQHASLQPGPDRSRCRQSAGSMVVPVVVPVGVLGNLEGFRHRRSGEDTCSVAQCGQPADVWVC